MKIWALTRTFDTWVNHVAFFPFNSLHIRSSPAFIYFWGEQRESWEITKPETTLCLCIKAFSPNVYTTHFAKRIAKISFRRIHIFPFLSTIQFLCRKKIRNSQSHNCRGTERMCQKESEAFDSWSFQSCSVTVTYATYVQ